MIIYFYVHVAQYFRTGYSIFFPLDIERDWRKKKSKIQAEHIVSACNLSWFCTANSKWSSSINRFLLVKKCQNLKTILEEGINDIQPNNTGARYTDQDLI